MEHKSRILKITYKAVPRDRGHKAVPWIVISGVWLSKAGFDIGDFVAVIVQDNSLLIKVIQKSPIKY